MDIRAQLVAQRRTLRDCASVFDGHEGTITMYVW